MQSETDRAKSVALIQTVLICAVLEAVVLLGLRQISTNFLEAAAVSIFFLGPLSLWFARPLYRYLLRENQ